VRDDDFRSYAAATIRNSIARAELLHAGQTPIGNLGKE
jgi:hypothetical protein